MQTKKSSGKKKIGLQIHFTQKCNFSCKHCYEENHAGEDFSLDEWKKIFDEYVEVLSQKNCKARINIAGGEPFAREDLIDFLEYISGFSEMIDSCQILTNGSLITPEKIREIDARAPVVQGFQISIEGPEAVNDSIRGAGSFQKVLQAMEIISKNSNRLKYKLSATISKLNHEKVFDLLDVLLVFGVPLTLRRFVPIGGGKKQIEQLLSPEELQKVYKKCDEINDQNLFGDPRRKVFRINQVCSVGLRFADDPEGNFSACVTPYTLGFAIAADGGVYRCRLLPKSYGNVKNEPLAEIAKKIEADMSFETRDPVCRSCPVFAKCLGGARCVAAAVCDDSHARDPQCWRKI